MSTLASHIIAFYRQLHFSGKLPDDIHVMNPYKDPPVLKIIETFFNKFYNDSNPRKFLIGINPGRFGGGVTGVMFTDPKRLQEDCGIAYHGVHTYEPSSAFIYEMISAYGGVHKFYKDVYINSVFPLAITISAPGGKELNYNYYDNEFLKTMLRQYIVAHIGKQIALGLKTDVCYCLGRGKNFEFLQKLNQTEKFFGSIVPLEHPRYIMQYKSKEKQKYIGDYLKALST